MPKKYEKIGELEFINGHTRFCLKRQERIDEKFEDFTQCACEGLYQYLLEKRAKKAINEKAM